MLTNKDLAISLAACESENEVVQLLKSEGYWNNSSCWRPFGDNENNWSTIGNQQSEADSALVEKLVNSIDGKPIPETVPFYPEYIYLVEIGKYDFALHEEHIIIYSPLGRNIKGQEIIEVECTKEEISELVELLDAVK